MLLPADGLVLERTTRMTDINILKTFTDSQGNVILLARIRENPFALPDGSVCFNTVRFVVVVGDAERDFGRALHLAEERFEHAKETAL